MNAEKRWTVDVHIDEYEDERRTRAEARLLKDGTSLVGRGTARRNPGDREVPAIGDELATARALTDLANLLVEAAASDIEAITHKTAHLRV